MLTTTINKDDWVINFKNYANDDIFNLYSLDACGSIFDDLIEWQEKAGEMWVKNLTFYDVRMIYTEYESLREFMEDYKIEGVKFIPDRINTTIKRINKLDSMVGDFKEDLRIRSLGRGDNTGGVLVSDFSNH